MVNKSISTVLRANRFPLIFSVALFVFVKITDRICNLNVEHKNEKEPEIKVFNVRL